MALVKNFNISCSRHALHNLVLFQAVTMLTYSNPNTYFLKKINAYDKKKKKKKNEDEVMHK